MVFFLFVLRGRMQYARATIFYFRERAYAIRAYAIRAYAIRPYQNKSTIQQFNINPQL